MAKYTVILDVPDTYADQVEEAWNDEETHDSEFIRELIMDFDAAVNISKGDTRRDE